MPQININVDVELYFREHNSKNSELAASGTFSFSLVDRDTRKLQRVPREMINAIKG